MSKSAIFFLHIWLYSAMEAPTPVSALIHAATLVTSGIYLLNRLYIYNNDKLLLLGMITTLIAGINGLFQ